MSAENSVAPAESISRERSASSSGNDARLGQRTTPLGLGVIQGMLITLRQFTGTYPVGRWLLRLLRLDKGDGLVTISYPEVKQQHDERFRYFPFLVYDGTKDNLRCVACRICEQECPPQCIHIVMQKDEKGSPVKAHGRTLPKTFDIDVSICMSCRICVDVCPFDAIEMDNTYEHANYARGREMVMDKDRLLKSNEYFQKIKPSESAVVDARMGAKKAKEDAAAAAAAAPKPAAPGAPEAKV